MVGSNVISCVLNSLNSGTMPIGLNETYICLIPKVKCPKKIIEFKPISLCNISPKPLQIGWKKILPKVISEEQSAFVPGRQITDNVLVAFETMHRINQKRTGKEGWMAIKLDLSKSYGRVEWAYLKAIIRKMSFQERWISLSKMCVRKISYSILINGQPKGSIIPTKGLRQFNPISLHLFLLCVEGL